MSNPLTTITVDQDGKRHIGTITIERYDDPAGHDMWEVNVSSASLKYDRTFRTSVLADALDGAFRFVPYLIGAIAVRAQEERDA